jgi:hypothetical protein
MVKILRSIAYWYFVSKKKWSDFYCLWKKNLALGKKIVFCIVLYRSMFFIFLLVIELSVLLRFTVSDYTFGIFKLFLPCFWSKSECAILPGLDCAVTLYHCWRCSKQVCLKVPWHWQKKLTIINLMWQETLHQCMS